MSKIFLSNTLLFDWYVKKINGIGHITAKDEKFSVYIATRSTFHIWLKLSFHDSNPYTDFLKEIMGIKAPNTCCTGISFLGRSKLAW